ncbi:hypothetical protein G9298_28465 (plasmid) [Bacillus thuringiensis]|nr:hypothetical protein G9298_28465 [Bacillus thuringiensis]
MPEKRRLRIQGTIEIVDDENFPESDEYCPDQLEPSSTPLTQDNIQQVYRDSKVCGKEVRIEISLNGLLLENGDIRVTGDIKLYEGVSDSSNDLDGTEDVNFLVPANGTPTAYPARVRNRDEGGDYAKITFNCTNYLD